MPFRHSIRVLVLLEEVHRPVEMMEFQLVPTLEDDVFAKPLLEAVELRRWRQRAVRHHREAGTLDGQRLFRRIAHDSRQEILHPQPRPQLLDDVDVAVRPRVDEPPALAPVDELRRGDAPQDPARQLLELVADARVVGAAEVVDDSRLRPTALRVPDALDELEVRDHLAARAPMATLDPEGPGKPPSGMWYGPATSSSTGRPSRSETTAAVSVFWVSSDVPRPGKSCDSRQR